MTGLFYIFPGLIRPPDMVRFRHPEMQRLLPLERFPFLVFLTEDGVCASSPPLFGVLFWRSRRRLVLFIGGVNKHLACCSMPSCRFSAQKPFSPYMLPFAALWLPQRGPNSHQLTQVLTCVTNFSIAGFSLGLTFTPPRFFHASSLKSSCYKQ